MYLGNQDFVQIFAAVLFLVVNDVEVNPPPTVSHNEGGPEGNWRIAENCGVNAAYVYLRLRGSSTKYSEVFHGIPRVKGGTSMEDIRRFVSANGIESFVVKVTPDSLTTVSMPCIALVDPETSASYDSPEIGHFIVLLGFDDRHIRYVDGTTGAVRILRTDLFCRIWSGYLIVTIEERYRIAQKVIALLVSGLACYVMSKQMATCRGRMFREYWKWVRSRFVKLG